ncbi:MAG TPA: hypothetical protein VLL07_00410 [Pontiella sp.]|nr:hypothetical protein [Pontiella sp.]
MKKIALLSVLILSFVCAWGLVSSDVTLTVNGQQFHGPFETMVGGWGLIIATVAVFCAAILMAFVLAGAGLIILGVLALVGFLLLAAVFPFLLPVLFPLLIVWVVCAGTRRKAQND